MVQERKKKTNNKVNKQKEIEQKKRKKRKKILVLILTILVLVCIGTYLLKSPGFRIQEVSIKGNEQLAKEKIMKIADIKIGDNIFIKNGEVLKVKLKQNGYIEDVKIKKIYPNRIEIEIKERKKQFQIKTETENYIYIDEQGYILEISSENITDKIKIRGYKTTEDNIKPGNRLIKEDLNKLNDVAIITDTAKNSGINAQITSINIENQNEYSLYMESEKKTVHIGSISNLDTKMLYLQVMLEKEKDNEGEINLNRDFKTQNPYFKEKV